MFYREHIKACKDTKSSNKKQSLPRFFSPHTQVFVQFTAQTRPKTIKSKAHKAFGAPTSSYRGPYRPCYNVLSYTQKCHLRPADTP